MKKKIATLLVLVIVIGLSTLGITKQDRTFAKTAQMQIEVPDSIQKENEFIVRVVLNSDVNLYSVDAFLSYNADVLEYVPENDCVTGSAGVLELKDSYGEETKKAEYELKFKALDIGKTEIGFSDVYLIDYADMDYIEVSPSAKSFDIEVNCLATEDARLSDLLVAPGDFTEQFNPNQLVYEMYVGLEVDKVSFSAVPMEKDSVVESEIPDMLSVGKNVIQIKVTALSGDSNVYTVIVYKKAMEEETETFNQEKEVDDEVNLSYIGQNTDMEESEIMQQNVSEELTEE